MIQSHISSANRACALLYSYIKQQPYGIWLLPVNICPDVPLTFGLADIPFQFVDIDPQSLCIDLDCCQEIIAARPSDYAGIVYVRTYGYLSSTTAQFAALKKAKPGICIIDDRCLCVPDSLGTLGCADMVLYSTGHCKPIDMGAGGLAFTDEALILDIDSLHYNGTDEEQQYKEAYASRKRLQTMPRGWLKIGSFMPPIEYLEEIAKRKKMRLQQRERLNAIYRENLPNEIQLSDAHQNWRFNILVHPELKNVILEALFSNGLFASSHYHSANKLFDSSTFPHSDRLFNQVINLFNDHYYTEEKAYQTCKIINKAMNGRFTPPILKN